MNILKPMAVAVLVGSLLSSGVVEAKTSRKSRRPTTSKKAPAKPKGLTPAQKQAASDAIKELRKLNAAVSVGLNLSKYTDRIIDAKASIEESLTSIPAGELKTSIQSALRAYEDAKTVWQTSQELDYVTVYLDSVKEIFSRYGIKVKKPGEDDFSKTSDPFAAIEYVKSPLSDIWGVASKHINKASSLNK